MVSVGFLLARTIKQISKYRVGQMSCALQSATTSTAFGAGSFMDAYVTTTRELQS